MREWLDLWHELLGDPSIPPFSGPDDMAGVLADFRRDRDTLGKAFERLPNGPELLTRVKRCIDAEPHHGGLYLVPNSAEADDDEIRKLVVDAIERGSRCCEIDVPNYPINILRRKMSTKERMNAAPLVEELGDLYIDITYESDSPECQAMKFLRESLYTLAASSEVQGYCLTALCPDDVRQIDPYGPQIELWLRGAHAVVRWSDDSDDLWVDVFVS